MNIRNLSPSSAAPKVFCNTPQTGPPDAAHIAYWDPARILAEIAAKRVAIAQHEKYSTHPALKGPKRDWCDCQDTNDGMIHGEWPCDTLKAFASVYDDCPEDWHT